MYHGENYEQIIVDHVTLIKFFLEQLERNINSGCCEYFMRCIICREGVFILILGDTFKSIQKNSKFNNYSGNYKFKENNIHLKT